MSKNPPKGRGRRKDGSDLFIHARTRFREYFGHDLTREQHAELGRMIRGREGTLLVRQTGSRSIWKLAPEWMPHPVDVVYQKPLSAVCTALQPYMTDQIVREHSSGQGWDA